MGKQNKQNKRKLESRVRESKRIKDLSYQKTHSKERFQERFEIKFSKEKRSFVIDQIKSRRANFIKASHSGRKIYGIHIEGRYVHVVYDPTSDNIVTVLPKKGGA